MRLLDPAIVPHAHVPHLAHTRTPHTYAEIGPQGGPSGGPAQGAAGGVCVGIAAATGGRQQGAGKAVSLRKGWAGRGVATSARGSWTCTQPIMCNHELKRLLANETPVTRKEHTLGPMVGAMTSWLSVDVL